MQILLGLALIIGMCWPAIKFILSLDYGFFILIIAILVWRSCLK